MNKVYVVQHARKKDKDNEDVKFIGVFSSLEKANEAIDALKSIIGFRSHPCGFSVDDYEIDKAFWVEGFGSDGEWPVNIDEETDKRLNPVGEVTN